MVSTEKVPEAEQSATGSNAIDSMNDAELGAFCRQVLHALNGDSKEDPNSLRSGSTLAAMYLVGRCIDIEGGSASFDLYGLTIGDRRVGDWVVSVQEKTGDDADQSESGPPVLLGGHLKPKKAEEALACFEKLTVLKLRMARDRNAAG